MAKETRQDRWIVKMQSSDGERIYGPFAKPGDVVTWARKVESEGGYARAWAMVRLQAPWK